MSVATSMKYGAVIVLSGLSCTTNSFATDCSHYGRDWASYANRELAVEFCHPPGFTVQTEGRNIHVVTRRAGAPKPTSAISSKVELALNGTRMHDSGGHVLTLKTGKGDFGMGNAEERIFVEDGGVVRAGIGRFSNPPAKQVGANGWSGYKTQIVCSTSDPETGFHAAGGLCLWVLGSDGRHYFVANSSGEAAATAWKIIRSVRFRDDF